jgi:hypothetical protein
MHLDIRTPVGLFFALVGVALMVWGSVGDPAMYAHSLGVNINLWWGMAMTAFGVVLLWLARRR